MEIIINNIVEDSLFSHVNVLLLCGIPGVGKTFISSILRDQLKFILTRENQSSLEIFYLNFDEIFYKSLKFNQNYLLDSSEEKFNLDLSQYRSARNEFYSQFKELVENNLKNVKNNKILIVLDDNFYFKSMRKPFYKYLKYITSNKFSDFNKNELSDLISCSYLELHIKCPIDYALTMNFNREGIERIPAKIINKINEHFQWSSFHRDFIYEIQIFDEDSYLKINYNKLIARLNCTQALLKVTIETKGDRKTTQKEGKALLLDIIEDKVRKSIGKYARQNTDMEGKGKDISESKKTFMNYIKFLLFKNDKLSSNLNSPILLIDKIKIFSLIESIKEEGYSAHLTDSESVNQIINEFHILLCNI